MLKAYIVLLLIDNPYFMYTNKGYSKLIILDKIKVQILGVWL